MVFECESCRQLARENEALRRELAGLKASSVGKKLVWLPIAFWMGWIVMAFPPVLLVALFTNFLGSNDNWIDYVFYGVQYSIPWTHWAIATCLIMLLAAPIWQRVILYVLTSSLLFFVYGGIGPLFGLVWEDFEFTVYTAPIVSVFIAAPIFLGRFLRRWTVSHRARENKAQPVSLATYLALTMFIGMLLVGYSWFPKNLQRELIDDAASISSIFASPVIACSIFAFLAVPGMLQDPPLLPNRGLLVVILLISVSLVAASSPILFEHLSGGREYWNYATFGITFVLSFAFWFGCAMTWMRLFGYRLLTHKSDSAMSSPS